MTKNSKGVAEVEAPPEVIAPADPFPRTGDVVYYNETRGPVAAIVQHVYPKNVLRIWVYGAQSIYPKDGVVEGDEIGYWKRR